MLAQVIRVLTVDDIASDKLYKTSIDIGGGQTRQVIVSLLAHANCVIFERIQISGIDFGSLLCGNMHGVQAHLY